MAQTATDLRQGYSATSAIDAPGQEVQRLDGFSGQA